MLQFKPAYFFSDEPNLIKKICSCERALRLQHILHISQNGVYENAVDGNIRFNNTFISNYSLQ